MFKLPTVRGFPRTSNTAQICGHIEDSRKGKHPPLVDADLGRLFDLRRQPPRELPPRELNRTPGCTAYITVEERKLYIPTGEHYTKKNGEQGAEQKIPFILVTATAHIMHGKHRAFFYRVTNRSTKIFDSRDNKRKLLGEVTADLLRLCPVAIATATADSLAEMLQPPRERKPRQRKTRITTTSQPFSLTVKRVPFSARKWLLSDKWLYT